AGNRRAQSGEFQARSVGTGADCPRDRLPVDISHIFQREVEWLEQRGDLPKPGSSAEEHLVGERVDFFYSLETIQVQQHPVGMYQRGKGMPGADGAHRLMPGSGLLEILG